MAVGAAAVVQEAYESEEEDGIEYQNSNLDISSICCILVSVIKNVVGIIH